MELNRLFQLLLRKWWVILLTVLVTLAGTVAFTLTQTPIYSASATYIVSPSAEVLNSTGFLSGLSVLGGQSTVANTYASIAKSNTVRQNASTALGLNPAQTRSLGVESRVQANTNLIVITVEGSDPALVQSFVNEVGKSTLDYVNTLYEVYDMNVLDAAVRPELPVWPKTKLNIVLGLALGFVLGGGLVLLIGDRKSNQPHAVEQPKETLASPGVYGESQVQ